MVISAVIQMISNECLIKKGEKAFCLYLFSTGILCDSIELSYMLDCAHNEFLTLSCVLGSRSWLHWMRRQWCSSSSMQRSSTLTVPSSSSSSFDSCRSSTISSTCSSCIRCSSLSSRCEPLIHWSQYHPCLQCFCDAWLLFEKSQYCSKVKV